MYLEATLKSVYMFRICEVWVGVVNVNVRANLNAELVAPAVSIVSTPKTRASGWRSVATRNRYGREHDGALACSQTRLCALCLFAPFVSSLVRLCSNTTEAQTHIIP